MTNTIKLPSFNSKTFHTELIAFGHFLEKTIRLGCKYDLHKLPNRLWSNIQKRMLEGLHRFMATKVRSEEVLMLQWYNSGIFIKTGDKVLGFDILPIPRFYNWPDNENLNSQIAKMLDMLFITHEHEDHFDKILIDECRNHNKLIMLHPALANNNIIKANHNQSHDFLGFNIVSKHATHVWRKQLNDVYLAYYKVTCPNGFTFLFTGDADYTRLSEESEQNIDLLFLTWRNPNSCYENGHTDQIGTTLDAVNIAIKNIQPARIVFEHYGELDHIYKGFAASFDLAVSLINDIKLPTNIYFWGDIVKLQ